MRVRVIGAGLAGSEAAWYLARRGYDVELIDEKPDNRTLAHHASSLAELVCSNSLKSESPSNACGLLKLELKELESLIVEAAYAAKLKAGEDLVVDRTAFSDYITERLNSHPRIHIVCRKVLELPADGIRTIVATGPLTETELAESLRRTIGSELLSFYDAAAPLVYADSLDLTKLYRRSRYDKGEGEYLNCPLTKEEYDLFVNRLLEAPRVILHDFEHFEGCLPLEVMARRGAETLRHGPLKAKGLPRPDGSEPYAVVQLRLDDAAESLYNLVGFQTNITYGAQRDIISALPGFAKVKFARFGLMHRNTYVEAPSVLTRTLSLIARPEIKLAGQLSGVEGYVESAASGLLAAIYLAMEEEKGIADQIPLNTMLGSLVNYLVMSSPKHFAPMNATYGIVRAGTRDRQKICELSLEALGKWKAKNGC